MNLETNDVELEPWLDNFLGASPDLAVSNTLRRSFQDTCHKYNVTLKPNDSSPWMLYLYAFQPWTNQCK